MNDKKLGKRIKSRIYKTTRKVITSAMRTMSLAQKEEEGLKIFFNESYQNNNRSYQNK